MTSWKPNDFRDRSFSVGDLVELRDQAEKGFWIVYRVRCVCADGALQLDNVSANDGFDSSRRGHPRIGVRCSTRRFVDRTNTGASLRPARNDRGGYAEFRPERNDLRIVIDAVNDAETVIAREYSMDVALDLHVSAEVVVATHERARVRHRHVPVEPRAGGLLPAVHTSRDYDDAVSGVVMFTNFVEHMRMRRARFGE